MKAACGTTAKHFDAIVALVAGGMQIKAACHSRPEFPNYVAFKKFIQNHPDYRARLDAVRPFKVVGEALIREKFETIIELLVGGETINGACAAIGADSQSLYRTLKSDGDADRRFRAAIQAREAGPNARGASLLLKPKRRFKEADFDAAIEALRASSASSIEAALPADGMSKHNVFTWAARSAVRMEQLRAALAARPRPGRFTDEQFDKAFEIMLSKENKKYETALVAEEGAAPRWAIYSRKRRDAEFKQRFNQVMNRRRGALRKAPPPVHGYAMLRTSLYQNELYRAASAVVPAKIDPVMRDDMISEIILAVKAGSLAPDEIETRGFEVARQYERLNNVHQFKSLEHGFGDGSGDQMSFLDNAARSDWSFEGAI